MPHRSRHAARLKVALGFFAAAIFAAAATGFGPQAAPSSGRDATKTAIKVTPYPLEICIVSGEKLGAMGKAVVKEYDGRQVRFCCQSCVAEFEKDQAAFMKKIDEKIVEQQLPHYPLKTCVVMEKETLGAEGEEPIELVLNNRLVRLCCKGCVREVKADPAAYFKKLDDAVIAQQKDAYPLETCPISGAKLGENAVNHVFGVTLVRFCCAGCVNTFEADPLPVMAKVHDAWMAKHPHADDAGKKSDTHAGHGH